MTATPTPLRELPAQWRERAKLCQPESAQTMQICAAELEAALSARDAAGADFWRQFALPPLPQCWTGAPVSVTWEEDGETTTREVYTAEQMVRYANAAVEAALLAAATPPASGEAALRSALQQIAAETSAANATEAADRFQRIAREALAIAPPAASGDDPVGELIEAVLAERLTRRSGTGAEHSSATARVTAALLAVGDARRLAAGADAVALVDELENAAYEDGSIQNDERSPTCKQARAALIRRLAAVAPAGMADKVVRQVWSILGPLPAPICCGCNAEWTMALEAMRDYLGSNEYPAPTPPATAGEE